MKKALFALTLCLSVTALQAKMITFSETVEPTESEIRIFFDDQNKTVTSGKKDNIKLACNKVKTSSRYFKTKKFGSYTIFAYDNVAERLASFFLTVKTVAEDENWWGKSNFIKKNILPAFNKHKEILEDSLNKPKRSKYLNGFLEVKEFFKKYQ